MGGVWIIAWPPDAACYTLIKRWMPEPKIFVLGSLAHMQ